MAIPDVPREAVVEALRRFDDEFRHTERLIGWEVKGNYRYALVHEGRRYPVKEVVALAAGIPNSGFISTEAVRWLQRRGFTVAPLSDRSDLEMRPTVAQHVGGIDQARAAFTRFVAEPASRFGVKLRRRRAAELRHILADPAAIDLDTFNREVWPLERETILHPEGIRMRLVRALDQEPGLLPVVEAALDAGNLEMHGNYVWGSGTRVYGPMLKDENQKLEGLQYALLVLNDTTLTPIEKARQIMEIPGFGENISTGLVMMFHPDEFVIYNARSRAVIERLGFGANSIEVYQELASQLKTDLGAADFLELDLFFSLLFDGKVALDGTRKEVMCWWVNQGATYQQERDGGYLFAGRTGKGGYAFAHWTNVAKVRPGDVVVHYANGAIRAVSCVSESAIDAPRPAQGGDEAGEVEGYLARVEYHELQPAVPIGEVPREWLVTGSGPFTQDGGVKQGYLFPLPGRFLRQLVERFDRPWPAFVDGPFADDADAVELTTVIGGRRIV